MPDVLTCTMVSSGSISALENKFRTLKIMLTVASCTFICCFISFVLYCYKFIRVLFTDYTNRKISRGDAVS